MKFKSIRAGLASRPQLGFCLMYPAAGILERLAGDWDWIWIDTQHGQLGYQDMLAAVRAGDLAGTPAVVRVPDHSFGQIGRALDTAAAGVMVPCVDTPAQAKAVVDAAKFPPLGKRSYGARRPIDLYGRGYSDTANHDVLLICQIESPEAVKNADEIAGVDGVDALFLGPDDITLRRGYSMTEPRNKEMLSEDMQAVIDACNKHGKIGIMVGVSKEMLELSLSMGYHMIVSGGDVPFLANSSKAASEQARAIVEGRPYNGPASENTAGSPY